MQETVAEKRKYIEETMKQFKLVDMREQYSDIIAEAEQQSLGYMDFLMRLLSIEATGKHYRRTTRLLDQASFESTARLEDIDYTFNRNLDRGKIEDLGRCDFVDSHENVIIIGPPGVGKSMIATGIGRNACTLGKKVLFVNAKDFVDQIGRAHV